MHGLSSSDVSITGEDEGAWQTSGLSTQPTPVKSDNTD